MKSALLKITFNSLFIHLLDNLDQLMNNYNPDSIHQYRVNYKKIRALSRIPIYKNKKSLKIPKILKQHYKLLGNLRDAQLLNTILHNNQLFNFKKDATVFNFISHNMKTIKSKLTNKNIKSKLIQLHQKINKNIPKNISDQTISEKLSNITLTIIKNNTSVNLNNFQLHAIRKRLKDFIYIYSSIIADTANQLNKYFFHKIKRSNLLHKLGDIQDLICQRNALSPSQLKGINLVEVKQLENFRQKIISKIKSENESVNNLLKILFINSNSIVS